MISGVPLFRGRDNQDQLLHIMRIIGTPDDRALRKLAQDSVGLLSKYYLCGLLTKSPQPEITIKQFPRYPKISFQQVLPKASPQGE
jgi:negative regulator of the PHO system